jgi:hypothetical protein
MATGATRVHHTKTSFGDWDDPQAEANIRDDATPKKMQSVFAWSDPQRNPKNKSAYKFPHHEVTKRGAVGAANERACVSGIGILNGGRGGADIPKSERKPIYNHLAAHLRDAGRKPPDLES